MSDTTADARTELGLWVPRAHYIEDHSQLHCIVIAHHTLILKGFAMRTMFTFFTLVVLALSLVACGSDDPTAPNTQTGSLKGKVLAARSLAPLENALVTTRPASSSVRTNADGDYVITDVTPGAYEVHAERPDSGVGATNVNVLANKITTADVYVSTGPVTTGAIIGTVKTDKGVAVANAQITTLPALSVVLTNQDGRYQISDAPPGIYVVKARKEGVGYGEVRVTVGLGSPTTADITLYDQDPMLGLIRGVVTNRASGQPLQGVKVSLIGTTRTVETDVNGIYVLNNVLPGVVSIKVEWESTSKVYPLESKAGEITSFNIRLGQPTTPPAISEGLYAYYPCNGNGEDMSEFGRDASIVDGSFASSRSIAAGSALMCNGNTTALVMPESGDLNSPPLTVAFWMRMDGSVLADFLIAGKYQHPSGNGWILMVEDQRIVSAFFSGAFVGPRINGPTLNSEIGKWTHVAYTVDGNRSVIYVNGVEVAGGGGFKFSASSPQPVRFGSLVSTQSGMGGLNGMLDDIYVFQRVLSQSEIQQLMNAQ